MIFNTSQAGLSLTHILACWKSCVRIEILFSCQYNVLLKNILEAVNNNMHIRKWLENPRIHKPHRCFWTAVKWCICIKIKFQFLHMIFNIQQRTVKLKLKHETCWKSCEWSRRKKEQLTFWKAFGTAEMGSFEAKPNRPANDRPCNTTILRCVFCRVSKRFSIVLIYCCFFLPQNRFNRISKGLRNNEIICKTARGKYRLSKTTINALILQGGTPNEWVKKW